MRGNAACGHAEYDRGHCAQPGCPNDYRACQDCTPAAFKERDAR